MPRIPLVQDENLLAAVIELAIGEEARKQLKDAPKKFMKQRRLTEDQLTLLQKANFGRIQRKIVNVQTTNP
jgi:hypothetical protein